MPESLREVIVARLDALPASSLELLGVAAVIGREFDLAVLAELAGLRAQRAAKLLTRAEDVGIVSTHGAGRYGFRHALFREVLYAEHTTVARAMLHRKAGEQLEARYRGDLKAHLSGLAYHFFEAAHTGRQAKAIRYCRRAAQAAIEKRAYGEAVVLLERALQAGEFEQSRHLRRRFQILKALGQAQYQSGQLGVATQTLMKGAILAYRKRWWVRLAEALFLFELICQQSGNRHVASIPLHTAVLENIPDENSALRARVLASLAKAYRTAGQPAQAQTTFRESIALARDCGDRRVLLDCLRKGNWTVGRQPGTVEEGLAISREALALATAEQHPEARLDSLVDIVFQLCDLGEIGEAERHLVMLRELTIKERQPHFQNVLAGFETAVAILRGQWSDAVRGAKAGVSQLPLQSALGLSGRFAFQIFAIQKAQGCLGQMREAAEQIIAASHDSKLWLPGRILLHCELDQPQRAREALQQLGDPGELPRDDLFQIALIYLAEACARLGDEPRCKALFDLLQPYRGLNVTLPGTLMLGAVSGYLAMLAVVMARTDESRTLFEEAMAMNAAMGAAPALARTELELARLLLFSQARPDRLRAQRLLAKARLIAEKLQLGSVFRDIVALGQGSEAVQLTQREMAVLKIIATGSSNLSIAEHLNISHSTVATHVRNIFRKTGVANRTEAADFARRAGLLDEA